MIRSFEKSHPTHLRSTRASLNGRVPIIAVSASLVERERQTYIDAGFDGWILKPISFPRLSEIMTGIVEQTVRRENLYKPGRWEHGGWFDEAQADVFAAHTTPSAEPPTSAPGHEADTEGMKIAAASDDPGVKEEGESRQTQEQERLLKVQRKERGEEEDGEEEEGPAQDAAGDHKAKSMPELSSKEYKPTREDDVSESSSGTTIMPAQDRVESPTPMQPEQGT